MFSKAYRPPAVFVALLVFATNTVGATVCCEAETAECLACQADMTLQKYCALHRETDGCDEVCCDEGCSALCTQTQVGSIRNKKVCPYKVVDETYKIFTPIILESDVESTCPFKEYGKQNLDVCKDCSALHKPCEDQYMACGGCACTDWHTEMGLDIKTSHTCPELKQFFKTKNSGVVQCEDAHQDDPIQSSAGKTHVDVTNNTQEKTLLDGYVQTECMIPIKQLFCTKVPFKLKFECEACDRGIPKLLQKCCDACVEWVDGLKNDPTLPAHIRGYGWCSGCQVTELDNGDGTPIPFFHAPDYANYTEQIADDAMEKHIEDNVCSLLTPTCGATTAPPASEVPEDETEIVFTPCMHTGGSCDGAGGRRMADQGFMEAATPQLSPATPELSPNTSCVQFDASMQAREETTSMEPEIADPMTPQPTTTLPEASDSAYGLPAPLVSLALAFLFLVRP